LQLPNLKQYYSEPKHKVQSVSKRIGKADQRGVLGLSRGQSCQVEYPEADKYYEEKRHEEGF